ncbi:MAG: hypothetical protein MUC38_07160 [Cyclobacteriaceae bacterium]|jgi:hypothetical protein|nr:hypothetical protein [Cyclobacteriaceae bacterium]
MNLPKYACVLICVLMSLASHAQKVKYKDILYLLKSKQYEQAEPFLKKHLAETKSKPNPNALLFMGFVYQDKAEKTDYLKNTDVLLLNSDSALFFLDKAFKTITERDLRDEEEYGMYSRRDLRTGKFEIKLSDVQFDLETRMKAIKERKEKVKMAKSFFVDALAQYGRAEKQYAAVQAAYASDQELFLRADEGLIQKLKNLSLTFDSASATFSHFRSSNQALGKTGYNQALDLREVRNFKTDGSEPADFYKDNVRAWDYKRWAEGVATMITKEIFPMRENLVSYDIEINKLRDKVKRDSVSVRNDLTKLVDRLLLDQLKKYDPTPMPMAVFRMKVAELEYANEKVEHRPYRDSADVPLHISHLKSELAVLHRLDSVTQRLGSLPFAEAEKDYAHFITHAYGTASVLKSLIHTTHEFAQREKSKLSGQLERTEKALIWIVDKTDSIPLVPDARYTQKHMPLLIADNQFTTGLTFVDSLATGYFYTIQPSRKPDVHAKFQIDKKNFTKRNLPVLKALATADAKKLVYFTAIYSEAKVGEKYPVTVAKIYRSDGLAWAMNYLFDALPTELTFRADSGELSVKTTHANGENSVVVIDKSGKKVQ